MPPSVLRAMSDKVLHHRTPHFVGILNEVWRGLQDFFTTKQPVQIIAGTGSASMEAAVVNTLSPGDEAMVVVSGKFGERWAEMCEVFDVHTHRYNVPWGKKIDLENFAEFLKAHPETRVVFSQVCETSTATLHPIESMSKIVHQTLPNALFAVDAITGIGCMPLPMDDWGLDVVVAGSQKAFMIPAGLSFIALSERAWKVQAEAWSGKFYFDLAEERKANTKGDSQFSIPTPLIVGLGQVLGQVQRVGKEKVWARSLALSEATRIGGEALGLKLYSESPSPSVTALLTPSDSTVLRDRLEREFNITIMGGQDQLKGKILRVGHMGDVRNEDMLALFEALSEVLGKPEKFNSFKGALEQKLLSAPTLFP